MKNELIHESSPYLQQHAHNPVHWQPWGPQALQLAQTTGKPLLVSIGYSACHWCHVMEKESFEDEATAAIMNRHFINVKIDREERPDLDHIFMDAVQAMTGSGGWPLNIFLTPGGKPFYGGTYFPPRKAFNRASWTDVLLSINDAWENRKTEMEEQAALLTAHLKASNNFARISDKSLPASGEPVFTKEDCRLITDNLLAAADKKEGGFGKAPKFPQTFSISCLLRAAYYLKDDTALQHAELSLNKMLNGGIYDQLGGGLSRYSTDNEWLAPHFEKMLYDNALLITVLSDAFRLTKKEQYKKAIEKTIAFLFAEMKNEAGGYYAALDADSEGEEGKFYTWTKAEVYDLLGDDAALFCEYYDVSEKGNMPAEHGVPEGKNILRVLQPWPEFAAARNPASSDAETVIRATSAKLLQVRNNRVRPGTDDKILLGWNALLITAFCNAYGATGKAEYKTAATELYDFIEEAFTAKKNNYYHTYKNGRATYPAFLDDYAYLAEACIHLQEITTDATYLYKAKAITEHVTEHFADAESGYFFFTGKDQEDLLTRKMEIHDGATPAANSVMAKNLLYLSLVFDKREWHQQAVSMIYSLKNIITKQPGSFGIWTSAAMDIAAGINEIAVIGTGMMPLLKKVLPGYLPNKIMQASTGASDMPLLSGKQNFDKTCIYLCRNFECQLPVNTADELFQAAEMQLF
ncbi:MAG: thioredoxin domain-containing protein [Ferruginibacter sp.]